MPNVEQRSRASSKNNGRYEWRDFDSDPTPRGYLIREPRSLRVERNARNFGHFLFNHQARRFELAAYYGSASIDQLLQTQLEIDSGPTARLWSIVDTKGISYDLARVLYMVPTTPDAAPNHTRHTAVFIVAGEVIAKPVDDIHNIMPALPLEANPNQLTLASQLALVL